ncbi:MAG: tetratricopeptide repeat protein [Candidatus Sulfotelmatobacter sp.]
MAAHIGIPVPSPIPPRKRLDSWKEIATFFGRDERTVKRWEKDRGLPVYRVPGSARGGVFAYAEELTEWLQRPNYGTETVGAGKTEVATWSRGPAVRLESTSGHAAEKAALEDVTAIVSAPARLAQAQIIPRSSALAAAKPFLWLVPLILIVGTFLAFSFGHRDQRFKNALAAPHSPSTEAQDLYLKGRYHFEKRTPEDLNKAVDFFTQAIVHDPAYPAPYVGLADSYNLLREYSAMRPEEAYPRARSAAERAVELDPDSAEAHNSLAFATFWGSFDAATAEREFKRALEIDPKLPRAHHWYATFLVQIGRFPEALAEIERARQLDPSSTPILADKGFILAVAGRREEARALLTQLAISQPEFAHSHNYLAEFVYFPEGNYPAYFEEKKIVARLRHDPAAEQAIKEEESGYEFGGLQGLLEARLSTAQQLFERGGGSPFDVAEAHAALGHTDDAMKYLEIAFQRHDLALASLPLNVSFQAFHQNPEFRELVARAGLPSIQ